MTSLWRREAASKKSERDITRISCFVTTVKLPRRARATVELLRQETPNFLAPTLWPPNSPDLSPVDYEIWAVMQHRIYHTQIHSGWVETAAQSGSSMSGAVLNSRFLTRLLTSGEEGIESVSVLKEDISSAACELTMLILSISVTFNATCLIVTSLFTKSCQQCWPIHSCSFYKQIWGGRF